MCESDLISLINKEQLADYLWTLINIKSPTLHEREAALAYGNILSDLGAEVEIDETIHDSPNIIGHLKGKQPGKKIQLAGHIDHIPLPHTEPTRSDDIISGRGAVDMKSGLAVILEIVRVLRSIECNFKGEILVTVYGLHEAPLGDSRGLLNLIEKRIIGDSAIVFEGPEDQAVTVGKGQSIWNITLSRHGEVCHELNRNPETDNLLNATIELIELLLRKNKELTMKRHRFPLLGPESVFIGQLHYGDFYNRAPSECFLQGTWRWHPSNSFVQVQDALHKLIKGLKHYENISIEDKWTFVGESFEVDPKEDIVKALSYSYQTLKGENIPITGFSGILDTSRIVPFGKIPAIPIGYGLEEAHADYEYVMISRLKEFCKLSLLTVLTYLNDSQC